MTSIDWILISVFGLLPLWSLVTSAWVFFSERRLRPFIKAQREATLLQRKVGLPDPRDRR